MGKNILIVGESWFVYEVHVKGFDTFTNSKFGTGEKWLKSALEDKDYNVEFMPNHIARNEFPFDIKELEKYDTIILSDIGASTLLIPDDTFERSVSLPNRVDLIHDYVNNGGSLIMIGGYMTFSGIDAKGKWYGTSVEKTLPVEILTYDDRMEHSEGVKGIIQSNHEIVNDLPKDWPILLGYNKTILKDDAELLVSINDDPLIAITKYGEGRTAVFTSDCAPHWAPEEFCNWEYYKDIWDNLITWLTA